MEPTIKQIKEAIDKAGYLLEMRLHKHLEARGFFAHSDKQFPDQDTGKSREIDLYGWKYVDLVEHVIKTTDKSTFLAYDCLRAEAIIECKSNTTPVIFFTRKVKHPSIGRLVFGGFPSLIWSHDSETDEDYGLHYDQELCFKEFHLNWNVPYPAYRFSKLISKNTHKKDKSFELEWGLEHGDLYTSIEKLCKATTHYKNKAKLLCRDRPEDEQHLFSLYLIQPILVFSGPLLECRVQSKGYRIYPKEFICLDWSLDAEKAKGSYRIHIVQENYFETYIKRLSSDINKICSKIVANEKRIRAAIDIVRKNPKLEKEIRGDD